MKENRVVQTNHHADLRPRLPGPVTVLSLFQRGDRFQMFHVDGDALAGVALGRCEAPEVVDARDGADEVAVGHVCQRAEVGLVAALGGDVSARFDPLPRRFHVRVS